MTESNLKDIAINFASNLKETERYQDFIAAEKDLENDEKAQQLLNEFAEIQKNCQIKQSNNNLSGDDLSKLREVRTKLDNNEVIKEYYKEHARVRNLCQESFDKLSELLGMDLSQYISDGGGCC
ncbi:MAG: YlbF family regulator [Halarsenatibacteraceae bacterium]